MTTVHIKTYGCAHNMADSEVMAKYLADAGFSITGMTSDEQAQEKELIANADLVIYNTCTVKNPSEDKFFSQLHATDKPVVVAGCIPQAEKKAEWLVHYSAIGVEQLHEVVHVVEKTLNGEVVHELKKSKNLHERNFVPTIRKNPYVSIIPILQGCLGACTYCKTKFARGTLKSYPLEDIISQVRLAKSQGIKEIWLVSEDNGAYGLDIGTDFPTLLKALIAIEGDFKIRVGMFNPEYAYEYRDVLPKLLNNERFYRFVHIPIQAGNNHVLKDMVRPYTKEQWQAAVDALRQEMPDVGIATDIICGFPTESEEQWQETMALVKANDFTMINISKFYPRGGTTAAKMKLLPTEIPKARSTEITNWWNTCNFNELYRGTTVSALFTEKGKNNMLIGRTDNYKQVLVPYDESLLGKRALVKVEEVTRDDLRGKLTAL